MGYRGERAVENSPLKNALRITFFYFILGVFWIIISDFFLEIYLEGNAILTFYQSVKGIFFVFLTSILLFFLIKTYFSRIRTIDNHLKLSETSYQNLFEKHPTPMWVFEKDTLKFLDVNEAAERKYGYSKDEFLKMTILDIRPEEDVKKLESYLKSGYGGYDKAEQWRHKKKDGTIIDVEIFAQSVKYNDRDCRLIQAIDITIRKKIEKELIESEERYKSLIEKSIDTIYIRSENKFLYINRAGLEMLRADSYSDIYNLNPSAILHKNFEYKKYEDLLNSEFENYYLRTEEIFIRLDGSEVDVEVIRIPFVYNDQNAVQVIARDITEKKKYEKEILQKSFELQERNKELKCLYALSNIVSNDSTSWEEDVSEIIKLIPPAFQHPKKTFVKINIYDNIYTEGMESNNFVCMKSDIIRKGQIIGGIVICYKDVENIYNSPFLIEEIDLIDTISKHIGETIERKEIILDNIKLNEELEQRVEQRTLQLGAAMKELEAFSYSVSHDLRAPIRAIDGFSKILYNDFSDKLDDDGKILLEKIKFNTSRMGNLIDDLLSFSKLSKQSLKREEIEMERIANESFDEMIVLYPQMENLQFAIKDLPNAYGDKRMLKQVWLNLISNALKFSSKKNAPAIEIGYDTINEDSFYYIKDNGAGFNMEYKDKLFGVFQRLHSLNEFEGTGVGLALCEKIITRHGGKIDCKAEPGKGAIFYFRI